MELTEESIQPDIEVQDQVKGDVIASSKENIEVDMERQELKNRGIDSVGELVHMEQEETNNEENIKESYHLMDPVASPPPKNKVKPSDGKTINQEVLNDDQIIEVPHIDFIFGDNLFILEDCVQPVKIQNLKHLMVRYHIQTEFINQKKQYFLSTSSWKNKSHEASIHTMHRRRRSSSTSKSLYGWFSILEDIYKTRGRVLFRKGRVDARQARGPHGSTRQWAQPIQLGQFFGPSPPILVYLEFYLPIYVLSCI